MAYNVFSWLEKLITTIEINYPGFKEKTEGFTDLYNHHKTTSIRKSKTCNNQDCIDMLNDYISFFKDEHIFLETIAKNEPEIITSIDKVEKNEIETRLLNSDIFYLKISSFRYENILPVKELIEKK